MSGDPLAVRAARDRHPATRIAPPGDWRLALPEPRRRRLRLWLWSGAALTLLILVVGGITRLTRSGLSIVDWEPIVGVVPPLGEAGWREAFARYREFPEYQELRRGMTLEEFRFIYFWEYLHRLLARIVGLVFLVPCLLFWRRGYLRGPLLRRVLVLFGLGALQGFVGWFMVRSGLVDDPRVSHYRLAAHLALALTVLAWCVWLARELSVARPTRRRAPASLHLVGALLSLQILWGAFVAGLDAGLHYNTFPLMAGGLLPPGAAALDPLARNLVENPGTVQWVHRVLGTLLALAAALLLLRLRRAGADRASVRLGALFLGLVLVQYALGVLTLLHFVPVALGVAHQATAALLLGTWVVWLHRARNPTGGPPPLSPGAAGRGCRGSG